MKEVLQFYKNKRVLITGHTGFKGSWLSMILKKAGANVCGYALLPEAKQNLYDICMVDEDMESVIGDIRDFAHLKEVFDRFQPEIVFHLAAQPIVRTSYENPVYTYETNVMGTVNLMECIRLSDSIKSVINVTTDKVYDNQETLRAYKEEDYLDGYDPYSNSKSCSELVTHSYERSFLQEKGVAVSRLRAGNVIGGGDFSKDRIVPDAVRAGLKSETLIIRNPESIRPFQHVLEPLYVYLMVAKKQYEDKIFSGAYNIGPDEEDCVKTLDIVSLFAKYWGKDYEYKIQGDSGPHEAGFLRLDSAKLKQTFAWEPVYRIEEAVEKTVLWYKAYALGEDMQSFTNKQIKEFFRI